MLHYNCSSFERDFTHIDDVVDGVLLSLDHTPNDCSGVYNIGTGETVMIQSVVDMLATAFNKEATFVRRILRNQYHEACEHSSNLLTQS